MNVLLAGLRTFINIEKKQDREESERDKSFLKTRQGSAK